MLNILTIPLKIRTSGVRRIAGYIGTKILGLNPNFLVSRQFTVTLLAYSNQGMIALTDHTETSGGFCCVPQFHLKYKQWGLDHPVETIEGAPKYAPLVYVPTSDPLIADLEKILMKAGMLGSNPLLTFLGSFLLWDSRIPHQNFPNYDHTFRVVQYLTYYPVTREEQEAVKELMYQEIEV